MQIKKTAISDNSKLEIINEITIIITLLNFIETLDFDEARDALEQPVCWYGKCKTC